MKCYHCGDDCKSDAIDFQEKSFCCHGCKMVYEIIQDNDLENYYSLEDNPGYKIGKIQRKEQYAFLDLEEIKLRFLLFNDGHISKISFSIPQIHCSSCIWLLENLNRLAEGINHSVVNFPKRRADITFDNTKISLREVAELLSTIGYEPDLIASEKDQYEKKIDRSIIYKIGISGFCFGNIMLFSFPEYIGMEAEFSGFKRLFGYLSFLLAIPVFFYAGRDYLISAFKGIKQRFINIDVPIALGMITLFTRSAYEVISNTGAGYFDSLAGLVFFLLMGKWFQQKTYDALSFERDYKSYFPIAVNKVSGEKLVSTTLEKLNIDDTVEVRNEELIPSDGTLISDKAYIDYSFVTGESELIRKQKGDLIYAGGRQIGSIIRVKLTKEVNNSYLTQLWNQEVFQKSNQTVDLNSIVNKVSKYFTILILLITLATATYWWLTDSTIIWKAVTAVLIVACPCALALSVPFTLGNMTRIMGRKGFYLKNAGIIEKMAHLSHIVMDKTGTITNSETLKIEFHGAPLNTKEKIAIKSCTINSTHPLSMAITAHYHSITRTEIFNFKEHSGQGISGSVDGIEVRIGSQQYLGLEKTVTNQLGSLIHISIDDKYRGYFLLQQQYRSGLKTIISFFKRHYTLHLLSGDNDRQQEVLRQQYGIENLYFNQSPMDKLLHIKKIQDDGGLVLMLGDGLNDAGALKQSDIGIAISDSVNQFSPACDAILDADQFQSLDTFITLSKNSLTIIYASFIISFLYNIIGIGFAVSGQLSPVIAAILMPISSISVVLFTTLTTNLLSKKIWGNMT